MWAWCLGALVVATWEGIESVASSIWVVGGLCALCASVVGPMKYAELHCASAFSFLEGASQPEDLVDRAAELELGAVALIDRNCVSGAPRFWKAARDAGIKPLVGAEVVLDENPEHK